MSRRRPAMQGDLFGDEQTKRSGRVAARTVGVHGEAEALWTSADLVRLRDHEDPQVRQWANERSKLLYSRGRRGTRDGGPVSPAKAEALFARADAALGAADATENVELLLLLARCPWRWASELLRARFALLLRRPLFDLLWEVVGELGDPALLDDVIDAWRPGEPQIAQVAGLLAALAGRPEALPAALRLEAAEEQARQTRYRTRVLGQPFSLPEFDGLSLQLRCDDCARTWTYRIDKAYMDPESSRLTGKTPRAAAARAARAAPGRAVGTGVGIAHGAAAGVAQGPAAEWDGVLLDRIIVCKSCGAIDRYSITPDAQIRLMGALLRGTMDGEGVPPVVMARVELWDGSLVRRASEGLAHLLVLAERNPAAGEGWRRLGNMHERCGMEKEAEEAWRRAVADPTEAEAAYSLAEALVERGDISDGLRYTAMAMERLPRAKMTDAQRAHVAQRLCAILSEAAPLLRPPLALRASWPGPQQGGRQMVHLSLADLQRIGDWDRLAELIGRGFFLQLAITDELQEDEDSQLLDLLDGPVPPQRPLLRAAPKVGRNADCPCGSGRKHKRCCLGRAG